MPSTGSDRDVRRAWWSFALFAPSLVAAFLLGEGLLAALGHGNDPSPPAGIALMAGLPAVVVFCLPTLWVWHYGRRAERNGNPDGRAPVVVAVGVAVWFLGMNLLQLVAALVM